MRFAAAATAAICGIAQYLPRDHLRQSMEVRRRNWVLKT